MLEMYMAELIGWEAAKMARLEGELAVWVTR
jgi:hypothetical protein